MMKYVFMLSLVALLLMGNVSGCGWVTYEDIEGTRFYYDATDTLQGVHDSVLLMSRLPHAQEIKKNVYIPMIYNG